MRDLEVKRPQTATDNAVMIIKKKPLNIQDVKYGQAVAAHASQISDPLLSRTTLRNSCASALIMKAQQEEMTLTNAAAAVALEGQDVPNTTKVEGT